MKRLNNFYLIPLYVAMIVLALFMINGCASSKIVDAEPVKLVSSEKIKNSSKWVVCVESKSGKRYSFKHESNCWKCTAVNISENWNAITYGNGQIFFEPIK